IEIAKQMKYSPNPSLKSSAQKSPTTIGLIWPKDRGYFMYDLRIEIEKEAINRGLQVVLSAAEPLKAMQMFKQLGIENIIFWKGRFNLNRMDDVDFIKEMDSYEGNLLLLGGAKLDGVHSLSINRERGFRDAVRYLAELGHRRIAYI